MSWGISENVSNVLAQRYTPDYIRSKIEFLTFLLTGKKDAVKKPAAWLRSAIQNDYAEPDGFLSPADRERQANKEKERKAAALEAQNAYVKRSEQQWQTQAAAKSARLQKLYARYGTTANDFSFWAQAQKALSLQGISDAIIASMQILKLGENSVIIHVANHFMRQQIEQPRIKRQIEAVLTDVVTHKIELTFVVGDDDQAEEGIAE